MNKKKNIDTGKYNRDQKKYDTLIRNLYDSYPKGITLPPEYAYFVEKDILRILIRLARYKFVARIIKPNDSVLEIGCGSGLGSIFLSQHCKHVTGLDIKTTEIEEAQSINSRKNVDFIVKDFFNLEKNNSFDVLVALDVIEHYEENQVDNLFKEFIRHINKNGMVIIGTPSAYSLPFQSDFSLTSHEKCYNREELITLMDNYFYRTLFFSMNDEMVHTGNSKMAWYYFAIGLYPKKTT